MFISINIYTHYSLLARLSEVFYISGYNALPFSCWSCSSSRWLESLDNFSPYHRGGLLGGRFRQLHTSTLWTLQCIRSAEFLLWTFYDQTFHFTPLPNYLVSEVIIYIYIYIYMCVCVCVRARVCVCIR